MAIQLAERGGLVKPGIGVVGLDRQHPLGRRQRLLRTQQFQLRGGEVDQGRDASRQQRERSQEELLGGVEAPFLEGFEPVEEQLLGLVKRWSDMLALAVCQIEYPMGHRNRLGPMRDGDARHGQGTDRFVHLAFLAHVEMACRLVEHQNARLPI